MFHSCPSTTRTLGGAAALLMVLAPGPAAQRAKPGLAPRPTGLVAVIKDRPGQPFVKHAFENPSIVGVALQIHWNDIEPTEGSPDWSRLDAFMAQAAAAGKWAQVSVYAGFFAPAWALQGVQTDRFAIPYGPDKDNVEPLPMPWDGVYLQRWFAFLKALSQRYASSSTLRIMDMDGPTSVSDENTLPNDPTDLRQWQADGYTPTKYLNAWRRVLTEYAADFPGQYLSIAGVGALPIGDAGRINRGAHTTTLQAQTDAAIAIIGDRLVLQYNNLDGTTNPDMQGGMAFIASHVGQTVTGYQLRTSAAGPGMGAPGATPGDKLRDAINKGMRSSPTGRHVDFIQIYEADILSPDLQPVLAYGASLFGTQSRQPSPRSGGPSIWHPRTIDNRPAQ